MTTGLRRDNFLLHARERERSQISSIREKRRREDRVCCSNLQRKKVMLLGMVWLLQHLFLCACRVDLVSVVLFEDRNTSICYFAKHLTSHANSINGSFYYLH